MSERWVYAKEVFDALDGSRAVGFDSVRNIPISEYDVYARGYGFSPTEWREVWEDVQTIDNIWLSLISEKRNKDKPEPQKGH